MRNVPLRVAVSRPWRARARRDEVAKTGRGALVGDERLRREVDVDPALGVGAVTSGGGAASVGCASARASTHRPGTAPSSAIRTAVRRARPSLRATRTTSRRVSVATALPVRLGAEYTLNFAGRTQAKSSRRTGRPPRREARRTRRHELVRARSTCRGACEPSAGRRSARSSIGRDCEARIELLVGRFFAGAHEVRVPDAPFLPTKK